MIVIGVDVHKQSLTAVAVDEAGRVLDERTLSCGEPRCWRGRPGSVGSGCGRSRIAATSPARSSGCCWAAGEELVRVPPKLTGIARRNGRERGKSDPIDALAVARVALREPDLHGPVRVRSATGS